MASSPVPTVDATLCDRCGLCLTACPCGAIAMLDGLPAFGCIACCTHNEQCPVIQLGIHPCEMACPQGAIHVAFTIDTHQES